MAILEVDSIIVRYGKMEALHGVSLNVEKGNITALIGHNGGGKTTALETIAGLVKVHSGTITFKGSIICLPIRSFRREFHLFLRTRNCFHI